MDVAFKLIETPHQPLHLLLLYKKGVGVDGGIFLTIFSTMMTLVLLRVECSNTEQQRSRCRNFSIDAL